MTRGISYIITIISVLIIWEAASIYNSMINFFISSPSNIASYLSTHFNSLLKATLETGTEAFLGLLIGLGIALLLVIIGFYFKGFIERIMPFFLMSQIIPLITLAPLFVILFGIGMTSKVVMVTVLCSFALFISIYDGIRNVPGDYKKLMKNYQASKFFMLRKVYLPLSIPQIMSGLKIAVNLSLVGAIVAEFTGAQIGLGKNLLVAGRRLDAELLMSSIFLIGIIGAVFYSIVLILEKKLVYRKP